MASLMWIKKRSPNMNWILLLNGSKKWTSIWNHLILKKMIMSLILQRLKGSTIFLCKNTSKISLGDTKCNLIFFLVIHELFFVIKMKINIFEFTFIFQRFFFVTFVLYHFRNFFSLNFSQFFSDWNYDFSLELLFEKLFWFWNCFFVLNFAKNTVCKLSNDWLSSRWWQEKKDVRKSKAL